MPSQPDSFPRSLDRINLRLDPKTFDAIDLLRAKRPCNVSRNTWICEAIREKLDREAAVAADPSGRK